MVCREHWGSSSRGSHGELSVEDNAVQTSAGEPSAVEFVAASVTVEATTTTVPEVLAMALASEKHVVSLVPV